VRIRDEFEKKDTVAQAKMALFEQKRALESSEQRRIAEAKQRKIQAVSEANYRLEQQRKDLIIAK
jgi:hypothetical protein